MLGNRSVSPPSPNIGGLPNAGVVLGHTQRASKSICSSGAPLSSEYRLGTRVASSAERSRTFESDVGLETEGLSANDDEESGADADIFWIGERCTERHGGCWKDELDCDSFGKGVVCMPG